MAYKTRIARYPEDEDRIHPVWSWVYGLSAPTEPLDPPAETDCWYVGEEDGTPTTACKVLGFTVARGEADLSCGGVAAVATLSEHRQKGYGTQFMRDILPMMREEGHVVSSLYPFREPFYARVGYATCGWRWKIACPTHRLPKTECALPVRQVATADVEVLSGCHTAYIRGFSGSALRGPVEWSRRLGNKPGLIYAVGDPVEAYAWVKMTEFWGNVDVGEFAWSTERGHASIFAVLRGVAENQSKVTWMEPPNSRFLATRLDQGVEMSLYRPSMHRVLDVPTALQKLKPRHTGEFTIAVRDSDLPDNAGPWQVCYSPEGTRVEKSKESVLNMDIGAFSQAFMGDPSLAKLAAIGQVEVRDAKALESAERLLTPMPVCCMEFF